MPADSSCPDGQPHVWKVPTTPDPKSGLYPSECSRCHHKKDFSSRLTDTKYNAGPQHGLNGRPDNHRHKPTVKGKNKTPQVTRRSSRRKSHGFPDREVMKAREQEYLSRKLEIIDTYITKGSAYGTAKKLNIPESSLRQLLKRWDDDVQKYIEEQNAPPGTLFSRGEIVGLSIEGGHVFASIKVDNQESRKGNLRLGIVEIRCPEMAQ